MKCFSLACFGASKRRRSSLDAASPTAAHRKVLVQSTIDKFEKQSDQSAEATSTEEANERLLQEEDDCSESLFSLSIGSKKQASAAEKVSIVKPGEEEYSAKELINETEERKARSSKHPQYSRYGGGCFDDNGTWVQQETSESLFSLSSAEEEEEEEEEESQVNSRVLKSIDKATVLKSLNNDKENINKHSLVQDANIPLTPTNHSLKLSKLSDQDNEIGVDTSLSSWLLVEPEEPTTPVSMIPRGSPWSNEDRPILGALTLQEISMFSVSTSSTRSRRRTPDETPIIGTVGSYWTHTGQNMDSNSTKSEMDAKRKTSSSTLKTTLERAFKDSL